MLNQNTAALGILSESEFAEVGIISTFKALELSVFISVNMLLVLMCYAKFPYRLSN